MTPLQILSESLFWALSAVGFGLALDLGFPMPDTAMLMACVLLGLISGSLSNNALATSKNLPDSPSKAGRVARQSNWNYLVHALRWFGTFSQVLTLFATWMGK